MSKVLFLIVSGEEASAKAEAGITVAARSLAAKRYDDLKVLFFGPSEKFIAEAEGQIREQVKQLVDGKAVDSACVFIAEKSGVKDKLLSFGVELMPAGERIAHYVNAGYQVITF